MGDLTPLVDRLLARCTDVDGCWIHPVSRDYVRVGYKGGYHYGHRVTYEFFVAPIPEGLTLDHLGRHPACINPYHLEPVTMAVNLKRAHLRGVCLKGHPMSRTKDGRRTFCQECTNARKVARTTLCPKGHAYTPENTIWHQPHRPGERPRRRCRECFS